MTWLETNRLTLRNLQKQDLSVLFKIRKDPLCARYQRWDDASEASEASVATLIAVHGKDRFPSYADTQRYAIALPCGSCIGDVSIFYTREDRCFTLGISIATEYHRNGYAFDILSAVVSALRSFAPEEELVALIHPDNSASKRLFSKLGFKLECYAPKIDSEVYTISPV